MLQFTHSIRQMKTIWSRLLSLPIHFLSGVTCNRALSLAIKLCLFLNEFNITFLAWETKESNRTMLQLHLFRDVKTLRNSCRTTLPGIQNIGPNFDPATAMNDFQHVDVNAARNLFPARDLGMTLPFPLCDYIHTFLVRLDFETR